MKLFSIFSRPNSELNNKQKGQTFMELVIILLIAGTAVICIIWYFYWVLQSSVIDLKYKLEDVRTAMASRCGLPNPQEHIGDQPTPPGPPPPGEQIGPEPFPMDGNPYNLEADYNYQTVTIKNNASHPLDFRLYGEINGGLPPFTIPSLGTVQKTLTTLNPGVEKAWATYFESITIDPTSSYTVTINPG